MNAECSPSASHSARRLGRNSLSQSCLNRSALAPCHVVPSMPAPMALITPSAVSFCRAKITASCSICDFDITSMSPAIDTLLWVAAQDVSCCFM